MSAAPSWSVSVSARTSSPVRPWAHELAALSAQQSDRRHPGWEKKSLGSTLRFHIYIYIYIYIHRVYHINIFSISTCI